MSKKKLFIAADHAGVGLKARLVESARELGYEAIDLGTHDESSVDYPDYAAEVASRVQRGEGVGILVCGSGVGMSIAANRFKGVRAALCTDPYVAKATRQHNDANVLCLGARVVGEGLAEEIFRTFLETPFEGGRHQRRVDKIERS
ncbi:MAG: ribose 5-phosphate isomerase B [Sandaracinaceae bacterium]|nr:ribose 5-phosphate isomerase B [Sandaracinaceae bacterium]